MCYGGGAVTGRSEWRRHRSSHRPSCLHRSLTEAPGLRTAGDGATGDGRWWWRAGDGGGGGGGGGAAVGRGGGAAVGRGEGDAPESHLVAVLPAPSSPTERSHLPRSAAKSLSPTPLRAGRTTAIPRISPLPVRPPATSRSG